MKKEFRIRKVTHSELKNFLDKNDIKNIEVGHYTEPSFVIKKTESYVKFCVDGTLSYQGSVDDRKKLKCVVLHFEEYYNSVLVKILRKLKM